mmetsp:Transcript_58402/g.161575  ORF Transcript_58402/g.161575 Transcript_58402/m.161575 type:complete len:207 (+) Transcript_58402:349-969(+)
MPPTPTTSLPSPRRVAPGSWRRSPCPGGQSAWISSSMPARRALACSTASNSPGMRRPCSRWVTPGAPRPSTPLAASPGAPRSRQLRTYARTSAAGHARSSPSMSSMNTRQRGCTPSSLPRSPGRWMVRQSQTGWRPPSCSRAWRWVRSTHPGCWSRDCPSASPSTTLAMCATRPPTLSSSLSKYPLARRRGITRLTRPMRRAAIGS